MGRKRSEQKSDEKNDLFLSFVKDTKEFFATGKQPDSCARDMQYSLELQKNRLDEKGLSMNYEFIARGHLADRTRITHKQEDARYKSKVCYRSCRFERKIFRGKKRVYSFAANRNLYMTVMDTKGEQMVENEDYVCPNCGAVSTVKGLLDGCDYCNTFFKIDELFPKVTNFFMVVDFGMNKREMIPRMILTMILSYPLWSVLLAGMFHYSEGYDILTSAVMGGILAVLATPFLGYALFSILIILSLVYHAVRESAMGFRAGGSDKKFENLMREYSPECSFPYFSGKVISMLRMLMYAKDVQELPFYTGEAVGDIFSDIVDAHHRGGLALRDFKVEGDYCYVTVDAYMDLVYAKRKVRDKRKVFRMMLKKNITKPVDLNFSISKIHCKNCDTSFDATRQCNCPSCGTRYEVADDDWVVMSVEKR